MKDDIERILCAANYYDDGKIYRYQPKNIDSGIVVAGLSHAECIGQMSLLFYPNWQNNEKDNFNRIKINNKTIQGFITSHRRFVDRKEGAKIWVASGGKLNYSTKELFSEDLY